MPKAYKFCHIAHSKKQITKKVDKILLCDIISSVIEYVLVPETTSDIVAKCKRIACVGQTIFEFSKVFCAKAQKTFFDCKSHYFFKKKGGAKLSANVENKKKVVEEIKDKLSRAKSVVFVDFAGTPVGAETKMRSDVRGANGEYKVYKNTLLLKALSEMGVNNVEQYFHGATSVAISYDDEVSVAKTIANVQKDNKNIKVKFGMLDGKVVDDKYVAVLANIPSREELLAKLAFLFKAPMQKLAIGIKAVAEKQQA